MASNYAYTVDPVTGSRRLEMRGIRPEQANVAPFETEFQGNMSLDDVDMMANSMPKSWDYAPVRSPIAPPPPAPEAVESDLLTKATVADDRRAQDPALSWFNYGLMNPEVENYQRSLGFDARFEQEFAKRYQQAQPQTLEDYIKLGDEFIKAEPYMAPLIKKRMLEMPTHLKRDYEARLQEAEEDRKAEKAMKRQIALYKLWEKEGFKIDPSTGKPYDETEKKQKAFAADLAAEAKYNSIIQSNQKLLANAETPDDIKAQAKFNVNYYTMKLNELRAGQMEQGAPASVPAAADESGADVGLPRMATPAEAMRLPPGAEFIDPNGIRRRRP